MSFHISCQGRQPVLCLLPHRPPSKAPLYSCYSLGLEFLATSATHMPPSQLPPLFTQTMIHCLDRQKVDGLNSWTVVLRQPWQPSTVTQPCPWQTHKSKKLLVLSPIYLLYMWYADLDSSTSVSSTTPSQSLTSCLRRNRALSIMLPLIAGLGPLGSDGSSLDFVSPGFGFLSHGTSPTTSGKSLDFLVLYQHNSCCQICTIVS